MLNPHESAISFSKDYGVSLIKYIQCWDRARPMQLSQDKVDLYRVEVVADMIRSWSHTKRNIILDAL